MNQVSPLIRSVGERTLRTSEHVFLISVLAYDTDLYKVICWSFLRNTFCLQCPAGSASGFLGLHIAE
jgi:hypothetical protein